MEEPMQVPSDNQRITGSPSSRIRELGLVLPSPPTPLGTYVESSDVGNLLFLSGMLPLANGKLAISGRLGDNLSVKQGQEAALMASLNILAVAKVHLGNLDRLKKPAKVDGADSNNEAIYRTRVRGGWSVKLVRSDLWAKGRPCQVGIWSTKLARWCAFDC